MAENEEPTKKGLQSLADSSDDFSVWDAIGGWRGVIEAVVPFLAFTVLHSVTASLPMTLIVVFLLIVAIITARLVQRETLGGAISGMVLTVISVVFATFLGSARDFYSPGMFVNAAAVIVLLVSLIIKKPGIGWMMDQITGEETLKPLFKQYVWATLVWVAGFSLRLALELPLYFMVKVETLGVVRIITGIPLFALMLLISWLIIAPTRKKLNLSSSTEESKD